MSWTEDVKYHYAPLGEGKNIAIGPYSMLYAISAHHCICIGPYSGYQTQNASYEFRLSLFDGCNGAEYSTKLSKHEHKIIYDVIQRAILGKKTFHIYREDDE